MKIEAVYREVGEVAGFLWDRIWCERNGGNISVLIEEEITAGDDDRYVEMAVPEEAAGKTFFVTQTGGRLRELRDRPGEVSAIVQFDKTGRGYFVRESKNPTFSATSEFISHVMVHLDLIRRGSEHRVLLHCHPHELIALSHHPQLSTDETAFNTACLSMLPEVRAFVPRGMAVLPYALPGSSELARLTVEAFRTRDVVIWSQHGAAATGRTINEAFDYLDVANKGAAIYLQCLSAGFTPVGMSEQQMLELEREFNLPSYLAEGR